MRTITLPLLWLITTALASGSDYDRELYRHNAEADLLFSQGRFSAATDALNAIVALREASLTHGGPIFSAGPNNRMISVSYVRLTYIYLLNGNDQAALLWLDKAVDIEQLAGKLYLPNLNEQEKRLLVIERWLAWEQNVESPLDLPTIRNFYDRLARERHKASANADREANKRVECNAGYARSKREPPPQIGARRGVSHA